jgi:hypothetical protein
LKRIRWAVLIAAVWLVPVLAGGCYLRPLLDQVSVEPAAISPNADGESDATRIAYRLSRPARVSIWFEDSTGQRYYFRDERPRSPGEYDVLWGGVIHTPRWLEDEFGRQQIQDWVLPDGAYTWVIEAATEDGETARQEGTIALTDAETRVPEMRNFRVSRPVFTPNQDGIDDRTEISYFLPKDVTSTQVYLVDPDQPNVKHPIPEQERSTPPGEEGFHTHDYDGGVDRGADPPPDGTYVVVGEARDAAGNRVVVSTTLTLVEGGKPRASVVNGDIIWSDSANSLEGTEMWVHLGSTIVFTTYVENHGSVPIRTAGPWPGAHYRSDQNYNTLAAEAGEDSWYEQPGLWRFGIRFDISETDFPYRWAVGRPDELERRVIDGVEQWYRLPGKRGTVTGSIELVEAPPRNELFAWGGLIHQWVGITAENNSVDPVFIHVGVP